MPLFFKKLFIILSLCFILPACSYISKEPKGEFEDWSPEQFVKASKEAIADEKYKKAIKLLEQLESRYPFGAHSSQTQLDLSYAYYKNEDAETALASVERFIKTHPRHPSVDYAFYLKGLIDFNRNLGFLDRYIPSDSTQRDSVVTQSAYLHFEELIRRFPNSQYVKDAKQRMVSLHNALARHELHIARFYMDREAYLAAANRVNYILAHYKKTPTIPYALQLQIKAYRLLDLQDLAHNSEQVYQHNFPEGPVLPEKDPSDVVVVPFIWSLLGFDK